MEILKGCKFENFLKNAKVSESYQFMRTGYFCLDKDSTKEKLIFNRSVLLKDEFKKGNIKNS